MRPVKRGHSRASASARRAWLWLRQGLNTARGGNGIGRRYQPGCIERFINIGGRADQEVREVDANAPAHLLAVDASGQPRHLQCERMHGHVPIEFFDEGFPTPTTVTGERPVRGVVERTCTQCASISQTPQEMLSAGREDQFRYFARFVAVLLGQYGEYLSRDKFDLVADGLATGPIYATDAEFKEFVAKLSGAVMEVYQRTRRVQAALG